MCVCVMRYHVVCQLCLGRVVRYGDVIGIIIKVLYFRLSSQDVEDSVCHGHKK